ncbi:MAG: biotin synthase BioB, partial [Planctomycetes bacterium]|nr:biotin synthase BioB [Planctomycetota bacterium]
MNFSADFSIGNGPLVNIAESIIAGHAIPTETALGLLRLPEARAYDLMYAANLVKREFLGDFALHRCSIVNAKSGGCGEDCGFCAQSARFDTSAENYSLLSAEKIVQAADIAQQYGSTNFGIVTAMRALPKGKLLDQVCDAIREIRAKGGILPDASLGILDAEALAQLKDAGLEIYHHNLECSKSYYGEVTSTRTWQDNWDTLVAAKEVGLKTCCGGILGMGESLAQRVEFFDELRELDPTKVPLNFLVAI